MNRITPVHIVALMSVILLFALYLLGSSKDELEANRTAFKETQAMAHKLLSLKETYADQNKIKQSLQRLFNDPLLRSSGIETKFKTTSLSIDAQGIDLKSLNLLLGKLLNAAYVIESMKLTRVSESKADLQMEIKW